MLAWLATWLCCLPGLAPTEITASTVELTGKETFAQVLELLNRTGNRVVESAGTAEAPTVHLAARKYPFWLLLDTLAVQAKRQVILRGDAIYLQPLATARTTWIAYDGPWRARIVRRSIIAYENPALNRLLLQIELGIEPRYLPLLLTLRTSSVRWPGTESIALTQRSSYSFEGDTSRMIEVRLPVAPRAVPKLDALEIVGDVWVAPSRLTFNLPLKPGASETQLDTKLTLQSVDVQATSKTWELATELLYPANSLEWESHQSRLLSSMRLTLTNGKQTLQDAGKDIQTDQGRRTTARWLFRNVPSDAVNWQATLTAPASPLQVPLRLVFTAVELP